MSNFVEVSFSQSEAAIAKEALERLVTLMESHGFTGWTYSEADLEAILAGVLAGIGLTGAQIASVVPDAIFRNYGLELLGVPFNEGAAATGKTKWTVTSSGSVRHIPAGTQIEASGSGFYLESELEIPASTTEVANVQVVALERGTAYNKVEGEAQQVNPIDYVLSVVFEAPTSGGEEEEEDKAYLERLAAYLLLQAPRPITASNFAEMALLIPESVLGLKIGRATCIDGYNPSTHEFEGKPKESGSELTEVTSYTGISAESTVLPQKHPGSRITGTGIPAGATVVSVNEGSKTIKLSVAPTSEPGKEKLKAIGSYGNERTVTVFVAKKEGDTSGENEYTSGIRTKVKEYLEERRELNFIIFVEPASYNEIRIKTEIVVLTGYTEATVAANVKSAIEGFLSPGTWGNPNSKETGANSWLNATQGANLVRYNQIIGVIEAVSGVQYVVSGSAGLSIGLEEAPGSKTADLTMIGPAPLPFTKAEHVEVTAT